MIEWRPVVGHESAYEVSSDGQVRSLRFRNGTIDKPRGTPLLLKLNMSTNGYHCLRLGACPVRVHVLVAEAFHGPRPTPRHQVAHADGMRTNNHVTNLRWATVAENIEDAKRHGTFSTGATKANSKLTDATVRLARQMRASGVLRTEIAMQFGVSPSLITRVIQRQAWAHVQ